MTDIKVNLTVETNRLKGIISEQELRKNIKFIGNKIFTLEKSSCNTLNLLICDDSKILKFNKKYLKHNYTTDIITFHYDDDESDLIISAETVENNSCRFHTEFIDEIHRVIIHGILHICGYTDDTEYKRRKMHLKENYYLKFIK